MDGRRERLGSVDSAWLRMDEPGNLMIVTAVLVLREPVSFERFRDLVASRLDVLPRLRQRLVKDGTTTGWLAWETDPHFDLSYHICAAPLERPDETALQRFVGHLMSARLDASRPLWQMHFVPKYEDGCAVVARFHHCMGDGLAMLYVLQMLTDDPPVELMSAAAGQQTAGVEQASRSLARRSLLRLVPLVRSAAQGVVGTISGILARPATTLEAVSGFAVSVGTVWKILFMRFDTHTVFKGALSGEKRTVWARPIPVDAVREIARVTDSKLNDVVLSALAGGLRHYLVSHAQPVDGVAVRALVPVNLRPIEEAYELGNRFGLLFVPLPLGIADSLERLVALRDTTRQIKRSPERLLTFLILRMLGFTPSPLFEMVVNLFGRRCTVVVTNVAGPPEPLLISGTRLKQVIFWIPCSGHLGTGVSIFSYCGNLWLGVATDGGLVPDPEVILDGFEAELAALADRVRRLGPEQLVAATAVPFEQEQPPRPGLYLGSA